MSEKRLTFTGLFDKVAVGAIVAIAMYVGSELRTISKSIGDLNVNVATIMQRMVNQEATQRDFKLELNELRAKLNALEARR